MLSKFFNCIFGNENDKGNAVYKISKVECFKAVVPLKKPFATSRFTSTQSTNYIMRIECGGIVGVGEAAARGHKLTGDYKKNRSTVIKKMLDIVCESTIDFGDKAAALASIKAIYEKLERCAIENATKENQDKPYRGILSGFDIALLDLAAKKFNITVSSLLGEKREHAYVSASTLSAAKGAAEILDRLRRQAKKFDAFRCKGAADHAENLSRLNYMRDVNKELSKNTSYWLDLNEALSPEGATEFIQLVIDWMSKENNKNQLMILEQPIPKKYVRELCSLQQLCDDLLPEKHGKIAIMADESLWDLDDFKLLMNYGGCKAINIKVPKVGGLMKALELGEYVEQNSPDTMVYIGGMIGTSDIMGRAIYNLYKALPRIDLCTTSPAGNVEKNLASNPLKYATASGNEILLGSGSGLGSDLDYKALEEYKEELMSGGEEVTFDNSLSFDPSLNVYENKELLRFSPKELDNHLIEREALLLGLNSIRSTQTKFSVVDTGNTATFSWTMAFGLPKATRAACKKKAVTKELFRAAGAPVAEGRLFSIDDDQSKIVSYAETLGWPVVVKPGVGTGGVGVTANIANAEELLWAVNQMANSKLASERNDGTLIVEKHIAGKELRVLVAGGKAVSAVERIQPHVTGDGKHNVSVLVDHKNYLRAKNPNLSNSKLKKGPAAKFQLSRQGKTFESVPDAGEMVTLSPVFSISQGADTRSVIDTIHSSVLDAAVKATIGVDGLHEAGVDLILEDYTKPIEGQQACVCEVNTSPAISSAHFPMYGKPVNVARAFLCSVLHRKWGEDYSPIDTSTENASYRGIFIEVEGTLSKSDYERVLSELEAEGIECEFKRHRFATVFSCKGPLSHILTLPSVISMSINSGHKTRKVTSYLFK
ncbi:enolase C-terminal domain-like protein [Halomonas sp. AOP42-D1-22]|uniref:enolase C-terminal domain-like protein n=1 Tax=Halomonas sp. AOP42-D1-22 TaxID=3457667 RepID=UPI00403441B1